MPSANSLTSFVLAFVVGSSVSLGSYAACAIAPPPPFTDSIDIDSKYDPADETKSNAAEVEGRSAQINSHINSFALGIVGFSDRAESASSPAKRVEAVECLHTWLGAWADGGALLGAASPTGEAVRVWTLSSISSALLKLSVSSPGAFTPTSSENKWLGRLAYIVRAHHEPRFTSHGVRMNNHDYWAAWAVASTSALLRSRTLMSYPVQVFEHAMGQVVYDRAADAHYLPNETGRGSLGLHYTQFAVTPLAMLAVHLPRMGYPLKLSDAATFGRLTSFAINSYMGPDAFQNIFQVPQDRPSTESVAWIRVYATTPAAGPEAVAVFQRHASVLVANSRIGGRLDMAYR